MCSSKRQQELEQIIAEEKLKPAEAQRFVANAFRDGAFKTTGTDIDQILPPVSRFGGGNRTEKKKTIIQRLAQFFGFDAGTDRVAAACGFWSSKHTQP